MSMGIDLSKLPAPAVIDELDYDTILAAMQADFLARWPQYSGEEHDPITKVLEVAALRELGIRQNHNEKATQIMLAYAKGSNLDALSALPWLQTPRLEITPADNTTVPPTPAVMETDDAFRNRLLLAYNQLATAGSVGSYEFHALSADGTLKDVAVNSTTPGTVTVTLLSSVGDGTADSSQINAVSSALSAELVRPLTDTVVVQSATIISYALTATVVLFPGSDSSVVLAAVTQSITDYVAAQHKIGYDITTSGLLSALHLPGVQKVTLGGFTDIVVSDVQAAYNTGITIIDGGTDV